MARSRARSPAEVSSVDKELGASRREAAEYIAAMLGSLRHMAHQAELPFLAYLISVALEEANNEKQKSD